MTRRVRYEVLPTPKAERAEHPGLRRWSITKDGERTGTQPTKQQAIDLAVLTARDALKASGERSELVIKGRNGVIQDTRTYGDDPEGTEG